MQPGEVLWVLVDDSAIVRDFSAFCEMAGHQLLMAEDSGGQFTYEIRRGEREPD